MPLGIYALGHFGVDFLCARLVLGRCAGGAGWMTAALLYNFCAFALQMPLGVMADRLGTCRKYSAIGAGLVCLGAIPLGNAWTVLLAGLGNALYHVGGGRETLLFSENYKGLGIFVAPGALGILLGGLLRNSPWAMAAGLLLLGGCGMILAILSKKETPSPREMERSSPKNLGALGLLFLVVLLRSLVGMCSASPWKTGIWVIIGAALSALGKALGGFAADRFGGRLAGSLSLLAAAALFLLPESPVAGILAGLLFQMSMPITLRDGANRLPGGEGFVFGLMTFALFLGFLPAQMGFTLTELQTAALSGASGLLLIFGARRKSPCNM